MFYLNNVEFTEKNLRIKIDSQVVQFLDKQGRMYKWEKDIFVSLVNL